MNRSQSCMEVLVITNSLRSAYEDPANPRDTSDEAEMAAFAERAKGVLQQFRVP